MASHKRRVERKLKKDVKRKVQASRAKQQSKAQSKPQSKESLEQMMKLVALMKGNGVNTDQATLLKLREEKAKADGELARTKRESAVSIEQSKAKTKGLTKEDAELRAQVLKIQTENKNMDEEIERIGKQSGIDKLKDVLEKAKQLNVKLKSKKSAVEGIGTYLKDHNLSLEPSIELLSDIIKNAEDNIFKLIEEGKTSVQIDEFYNGINYEKLKNELQNVTVGLALKFNEISSLINKKKMDEITVKELESKIHKLKDDISVAETELYTLNHEIEEVDEDGNITFTQIPATRRDGSLILDNAGNQRYMDKPRDIHKELKEGFFNYETLNRKNEELKRNIKHKDDIISKVDKLNLEKDILTAENNALGEVAVVDKTAEMGRLNKEIADLNDAIRDKRQQGLDAKAYERKLAEKEREKNELEAENNATPKPSVSQQDITKYAKAKIDGDKLRREIDVKHRDRDLIHNLEDENAKQELENMKMTQLLRSSTPQIDTTKTKAITNSVKVELEKRLNEVKEMNYKTEQELRAAEAEGNAHNLPEIKAKEKELQEQITELKITEEKLKQQEALNRTRAATRDKRIRYKAERDYNMFGTENTGIIDAATMHAVIGDKIDKDTRIAQESEKYADEVVDSIRDTASKEPNMIKILNTYLESVSRPTFDTPNSFNLRIHTKEQADALNKVIENVGGTYDKEKEMYDFGKMPEGTDDLLNTIFGNDDED